MMAKFIFFVKDKFGLSQKAVRERMEILPAKMENGAKSEEIQTDPFGHFTRRK